MTSLTLLNSLKFLKVFKKTEFKIILNYYSVTLTRYRPKVFLLYFNFKINTLH